MSRDQLAEQLYLKFILSMGQVTDGKVLPSWHKITQDPRKTKVVQAYYDMADYVLDLLDEK
jgi:hypothetical protein